MPEMTVPGPPTLSRYSSDDVPGRKPSHASDDTHEYVQLSPPAHHDSPDPFEGSKVNGPMVPSTSQLSHVFKFNNDALSQNSIIVGSKVPSPPSIDVASTGYGLQIRTDLDNMRRSGSTASLDSDPRQWSTIPVASQPRRIPSVRTRLHSAAGSLSPGSVISSPQIAAMLDITPLPSPTMGPLDSWKTLSRTRSRASSTSSKADYSGALLSPSSPRRKGYPGLYTSHNWLSEEKARPVEDSNSKARSVSEYVPEALTAPKPRNIAVSGTVIPTEILAKSPVLQREEYLGVQRGLVPAAGVAEEGKTPMSAAEAIFRIRDDEPTLKRIQVAVHTAQSITSGASHNYEEIRELGQGTFSKVYLAVRQVNDRKDSVDYRQDSVNMAGVRARSRRLVAVKIVEPGPAGGADAERIGVSLKREVDIMRSIQHPSIVHLKAFGTTTSGRALLVMNYCPGGDLFDLASKRLDVLTPTLVRRIFSELVSAVRYLHQKFIVHRDIKLENVLLNIPVQVHNDVPNWLTLDRAVVTLTDLGLSRRIPPPPESPLLETRCGSEDYAAPEILMGQQYDGRQTDAWALGVLLYSLMEGRLPFDPLPGARGDPAVLRARTPHRIARCEWAWVKYGDDDGEWDASKCPELEGGMKCVDALLKRNTRRKPLSEIRDWPWVKDGIRIDGGLRRVEEEGM